MKKDQKKEQTDNKGMRWFGCFILGLALVILPYILEKGLSPYYLFLATKVIIWILFATSFNLVLGYGGMMSLGHAAFFGIGAYTCALLLVKTSFPPVLAMLAGPVAAALAGMIAAFFSVRVQGAFYFATITIAFCQIAYTAAFKWRSFTFGDDGVQGIPVPAFISTEASYINLYFFALAVTVLCLYAVWRIVRSPYGLLLRALKEDPIRATFIGMKGQQYRFIAFVTSAFFAGVAGVLYAFLETSVAPDILSWTFSGEVVLMSVLGGMNLFLGPAVGAAIMVLLSTFVTSYMKYWLFTMGTILVLIVLFCPKGVAGLVVDKYTSWQRKD
ncbi:MAG: branched-chain amino acid ABC transporter permease [Deltaproteobacteria bacterium]|nr:branched-chain amino acid ABC transporter permease [Deltaproteobacteria bacterium]